MRPSWGVHGNSREPAASPRSLLDGSRERLVSHSCRPRDLMGGVWKAPGGLRGPYELREPRANSLPLTSPFARTIPGFVAQTDDIGFELQLPHLAEKRQSPLPLPPFSHALIPALWLRTVGSSFACHISLRSLGAQVPAPSCTFSHAMAASQYRNPVTAIGIKLSPPTTR